MKPAEEKKMKQEKRNEYRADGALHVKADGEQGQALADDNLLLRFGKSRGDISLTNR
jgi:hypothetical protein